jgi:hypothetical protein
MDSVPCPPYSNLTTGFPGVVIFPCLVFVAPSDIILLDFSCLVLKAEPAPAISGVPSSISHPWTSISAIWARWKKRKRALDLVMIILK